MTKARFNNVIVVGADDSVGPKRVANDSGPTGSWDPTGARHLVEDFFCTLKPFRGIATRYDGSLRDRFSDAPLVGFHHVETNFSGRF
jgi:hypothetical protein